MAAPRSNPGNRSRVRRRPHGSHRRGLCVRVIPSTFSCSLLLSRFPISLISSSRVVKPPRLITTQFSFSVMPWNLLLSLWVPCHGLGRTPPRLSRPLSALLPSERGGGDKLPDCNRRRCGGRSLPVFCTGGAALRTCV